MDGALYIWGLWIGWVIVTFLIEKTKKRLFLAIFLLLLIISYNYTLSFLAIEINVAGLLLLFGSYVWIGKQTWRQVIYYFFCSLIVSFLYAGLLLIELYDPVMYVLVSTKWIVSIFVFLAVTLLIKRPLGRISVSIAGLVQGEVLFKLFLTSIYGSQLIGHPVFFDKIALSTILIMGWILFEVYIQKFKMLIQSKTLPANGETISE